jgi:hypothetical protein
VETQTLRLRLNVTVTMKIKAKKSNDFALERNMFFMLFLKII